MDERKRDLRSIVEAASSVVDQFHAEAASGRLPQDQAKKFALDAIRHVRYGYDGYLTVVSDEGEILAHGAHPEWETANQTTRPPAAIQNDIRALIDRAQSGGGFHQISSHRPEGGSALAKLAYSRSYVPWGWVLFTGLSR